MTVFSWGPSLARGLADLIFPRECAACSGGLAPGRTAFCGACEELVLPREGPLCRHCGRPGEGTCDWCREQRPCHSPSWAPFLYGGAVREAIHRFKYDGLREVGLQLADLLAQRAKEADLNGDLVVPVPLYPRRQRARGFNQSAILARGLARALGLPLLPSALQRLRDTSAQASLDRPARCSNLAGAFGLHRLDPRGKGIILVDDVITTGATVRELSSLLMERGARHVAVVALAMTPPL